MDNKYTADFELNSLHKEGSEKLIQHFVSKCLCDYISNKCDDKIEEFLHNTIYKYANQGESEDFYIVFKANIKYIKNTDRLCYQVCLDIKDLGITEDLMTSILIPRLEQLTNVKYTPQEKAKLKERLKILFTGRADSNKDIIEFNSDYRKIQ